MVVHLQRELEKLKKRILTLGAAAEGRVQLAVRAVETLDRDKARWIMKSDHEIDEMEVEVEEECLKLLALYQPVAVDLRFISVVIKINNDLERIGDEAVNISRRVLSIIEESATDLPAMFDVRTMGERSLAMLQKSLDALVHVDTDLAYRVLIDDDEVDKLNHEVHDMVFDRIKEQPEHAPYWLNALLVARHLERIADHATNIAEEVIYLVQGQVVRHKGGKGYIRAFAREDDNNGDLE
ncbi:MAG: phosphate signaling complex protein PhoU [Desulfatibacillaceae bacterium]